MVSVTPPQKTSSVAGSVLSRLLKCVARGVQGKGAERKLGDQWGQWAWARGGDGGRPLDSRGGMAAGPGRHGRCREGADWRNALGEGLRDKPMDPVGVGDGEGI